MPGIIPFLDLAAQARGLEPELSKAINSVVQSGHYVLGKPVKEFEQEFAAFAGAVHAIAVNTGTSALHLALLASGIGQGDEVITTPMTFVATVAAILYVGAVPRLVDIDPATANIDPRAIEPAITPRTRAVLPVHLHGRTADMATINEIAERHGLVVIEDAAQAHGANYDGRPIGSLSDVACFSFYPGKNLGACGEGGALVTNNPTIAHRARLLRDWGQEEKYVCMLKGFNYRMDALQGAILRVKLRNLHDWTAARRSRAARYNTLLSQFPVQIPAKCVDGEHVYHVYAIRVPNRDRVRRSLAQAGIETGIHYPLPVHLQPAYADLGYTVGAFPVAEDFAAETLSLPIYPELTDAQLEEVCLALAAAVRETEVNAL